ncbi:MAG: helix-turn-helix domain-containing protein [Desulfomonilaceae bacterium]
MVEKRSGKTDPQPEVAIPQLMDAKDVALILKIAPKTVHKLVRAGKLGCVKVTEKDRRFIREQAQAYIYDRAVRPSAGGQSECPIQDMTNGEPE